MEVKFLESDFFSTRRILIFGINRIQSEPTINHIKDIDSYYDRFLNQNIDEICCVSFCGFLLFDQLMPKLSKKIQAFQFDQTGLFDFQNKLNKRGHPQFLIDYWQFACILDDKNLEYYIEQPFKANKIGPDTKENIYSNVGPEKVLNDLLAR